MGTKKTAVSFYVLETSKEGLRKFWREALPAKTAMAAAKILVKDGFTCKLIKVKLTREDLKKIKRNEETAVTTLRPKAVKA